MMQYKNILNRIKDRCPSPNNRCCGCCNIIEQLIYEEEQEEIKRKSKW